mmetsp:Transcript_1027/g.4327  ORF Transcript_1027/g.4327 Transcript_1027/m.4327 type:complete len:388 (+) Transcript_1027:2640-3803(+)
MAPVAVAANVEIAAPLAVEDTATLCDLVRGALCFWRCERDYFFAEGSKCARARDACAAACRLPPECVVRALGTTREREIAKHTDPLERKEYLGTLTEEEARTLRRRRAEAARFVRRRAMAAAPERQSMTKRAGERRRRERAWTSSKLRKDGDDASVSASDEFGKAEALEAELAEANARRYRRAYDGADESGYSSRSSSYYSDESSYSSYTGSSYSSYASDADAERERRRASALDAMKPPNDATAMTVSRKDALGKPLIVGKHLAFATEGLLPEGLTRWEAYIAEAERAGELRDAKMRRRAERRDRSLHRELDALKLYANRVKLSEQDVQIRRQALIDAHDARVRESVEREVKIAARARRKRNVLLNLDHDARSRLLKRWALRPSAQK